MTISDQALRLLAEGKGDRVIARELGVTRHAARNLIRDAEKAKPGQGALIERDPQTPAEFAERISACWRASVEAILKVGRLLAAAKESLPHGDFGAMIESQLPFGARTAQMLMAIAADNRLTNPKRVSLLPPSWGSLYELHKLDDATLDRQFEEGIIRPDVERREIVSGARAIMSSRQEPDDSLDYFPTPPWATRALVERVMPMLGVHPYSIERWSAWDPACGEGHMAAVLAEYFEQVHSTDIHDYGWGFPPLDFLADPPEWEHRNGYDWIITNPPFGEKTEAFVLRALDHAKIGVAMFVRLQWLETIGRYERLFRDRPPTLIAFFCERVNLCKGRWDPEGSTATAYIWLVWVKGKSPQAPFWIPPGCRESLTKSDDAERFTAHPVKPLLPPHDPETGEIIEEDTAA